MMKLVIGWIVMLVGFLVLEIGCEQKGFILFFCPHILGYWISIVGAILVERS